MSARNRGIPGQKIGIEKSRIPMPKMPADCADEHLLFSFARLETNEYFNIDCACEKWSVDLFYALNEISKVTVKELRSGAWTKSPFRFHSHKNAHPPCAMPEDIDLSSFYQIRLGASKGGIHGVLVDNIFYVIWLDPLHNMYPDDRFGGARKIKPGESCCGDNAEKLQLVMEENNQLKEENQILKNWFNEI